MKILCTTREDRLYKLAEDIDEFYYGFDTYNYMDDIESREQNIKDIYTLLLKNDMEDCILDLENIVEECPEDADEAQALIERIKNA